MITAGPGMGVPPPMVPSVPGMGMMPPGMRVPQAAWDTFHGTATIFPRSTSVLA